MSRRRPGRPDGRSRPAPRSTPGAAIPDFTTETCWRCDAPRLTGRTVCKACGQKLERVAARLRPAPKPDPEELPDAA